MSLQTRLADFITAVGADIKSLQTQINGLSAGSDPWTYQKLTTAYTNSTITASNVFTGFIPAASTRYLVEVVGIVSSAAAGTGIQTQITAPVTGITRAAVKIVSSATATTDKTDHLALNAFQVATAGLTTPSLLQIQAIIDVGTPGAGDIRLQAKSEVAASVITFHPGSFMRWRTL